MADALMGVTETVAAANERVLNMVQSFLIEESKLMDKVMNVSSRVMKGDKVVKLPRSGGFTVDSKAENVAVDAQVITYATDDLALDKHKAIQVLLEDIANVQATPDIVEDIIMKMAKQMALQIDTDIITCLDDVSTAAPDHKIAYDNAATLGKADILAAKKLLQEQNVVFSECWIGISPASECNLLAISEFVEADKYGSAMGLQQGVLGTLYGAKVIMSNEFADLETLVWHPSHCGFAMQIEPRFEVDRDVPNLADRYSMSQLYGCKVLDSGKRGVLLGTAV